MNVISQDTKRVLEYQNLLRNAKSRGMKKKYLALLIKAIKKKNSTGENSQILEMIKRIEDRQNAINRGVEVV